MRSLDNHILKILSNNDVTFFIPPYQRNYEWDEEMCGILFKDIEKVTNSRNTQHFFGTVIYYAYKLKEILKDIEGRYDPAKHYKVINTGTIDKFSSRWGIKQMTYLKDKYLGPVVLKNVFHKLFPNSYGDKPLKKKLIIKGLTLLDCTLDINGEYVPGKTTIIVASENINLLYYLSVLLNSNISQFYITQKYSSASYNGGVNFTKDMINNFPFQMLLLMICALDSSQMLYFFREVTNAKDFTRNYMKWLMLSFTKYTFKIESKRSMPMC